MTFLLINRFIFTQNCLPPLYWAMGSGNPHSVLQKEIYQIQYLELFSFWLFVIKLLIFLLVSWYPKPKSKSKAKTTPFLILFVEPWVQTFCISDALAQIVLAPFAHPPTPKILWSVYWYHIILKRFPIHKTNRYMISCRHSIFHVIPNQSHYLDVIIKIPEIITVLSKRLPHQDVSTRSEVLR